MKTSLFQGRQSTINGKDEFTERVAGVAAVFIAVEQAVGVDKNDPAGLDLDIHEDEHFEIVLYKDWTILNTYDRS